MKKLLILLALGAIIVPVMVFSGSPVTPPIPHVINYQGMLTDNAGNPLSGPYNLTFRIYDDTTAGNLEWSEIQSGVQVQNGLFNVLLGQVTALNLAFDEQYWLEVQVGISDIMPRLRFTSVAYAYRAETAESDGDWTISGNDMYSAVSGKVGIGTTSPTAKLDVDGSGSPWAIYTQGGSSYSIKAEWDGSSLGAPIVGVNTGTGGDAIQAIANGTGRSALWARGNSGVDYAVYGEANGATWAGYFSGDVYTSDNLTVDGTITGKVPGVGTLVGDVGIDIPTTAAALISKSINVPGAGRVIAMCTGSVYLGGLGAGNSYMIRLKLNQGISTSTLEDGYVVFIKDTNTNSSTRMVPFAISRVFDVTGAGSFTANLTGWLQTEPASYTTIALDDRVLTLLYVPTTY